MNIDESAAVLFALSVANSLVTVGETEILFWAPKWERVEFEDAMAAANAYYAEGGSYQGTRQHIGPADVIGLAALERNRRTKRPEVIAPGCYEPEPSERVRLGSDQGPRALPGKLEDDLARDIRMEPGAARCQDVLSQIMARLEARRCVGPDPSESDLRLQRAQQRAAAERRARKVAIDRCLVPGSERLAAKRDQVES